MNYNFPFDNLVLGQVLFFGKSLQRAIFFSKFKQGVSGVFFFFLWVCFWWGFFWWVFCFLVFFAHMAGSL